MDSILIAILCPVIIVVSIVLFGDPETFEDNWNRPDWEDEDE